MIDWDKVDNKIIVVCDDIDEVMENDVFSEFWDDIDETTVIEIVKRGDCH